MKETYEYGEFLPMKGELITLAKYWAEIAIEMEYRIFLYSCSYSCSSELKQSTFAWARVGRISDLVGKEEVDAAVDAVYETFGAKENKKTWQIFLHGSPGERAALQADTALRIEKMSIEKPPWRLTAKLYRGM